MLRFYAFPVVPSIRDRPPERQGAGFLPGILHFFRPAERAVKNGHRADKKRNITDETAGKSTRGEGIKRQLD